MTTQGFPRIQRIGEAGLLVEFADHLSMQGNVAALSCAARIKAEPWAEGLALATSLKSVLIRFDPDLVDHAALEHQVAGLLAPQDWAETGLPKGRRLWRVPACFGADYGPQLDGAAAAAGMSAQEAIAVICAMRLRVLTIGFAPGMPYLGQLPAAFDIPRRTELNPHVPKGALGLAIRQIVCFPAATQTGWSWIGQGALSLFDPSAERPFALSAGDEVQFKSVSPTEFEEITGRQAEGDPVILPERIA